MTTTPVVDAAPRRGRPRWLMPVIGILISAAALAMVLRSVDWSRTSSTLRGVDPWLLVAGALVGQLGTLLFAARWRGLLAEHVTLPVPTGYAFIMIGYFANSVLPLRLGDVARAALLGRRFRVSATVVLGSIALERVLDVVTLLLFAVALAAFVPLPAQARFSVAFIGAGGIVALLAMILVARNPSVLDALHRRFPHVPGFSRLLGADGIVRRLIAGLGALHDGRRLAIAAVLSLASWAVVGVSIGIWLAAFHLAVPWYASAGVLAVTNLGGAIPTTPGAIGVYDYLATYAVAIWVHDKSAPLAYAFGTHVLTLVSNLVLGAACLARQHVSLTTLASEMPAGEA